MSISDALQNAAQVDVGQVADGRVAIRFWNTPPARRAPRSTPAPPPEPIAELVLIYESGDPNAGLRSVQLEAHGSNISASDLSRMPWSRYLKAAAAHRHALHTQTLDGFDASRAELRRLNPSQRGRGRPPKSDWHYQDIARRYLRLKEALDPSPTKTLSKELDKNYNTVSAWLTRARKLGYLPPNA